MMKEGINKEMIFNYFAGRATAFEKEVIDQWATESDGKEQFFVWLQEWENQNLQYAADVEKGITRHWQRKNFDTSASFQIEDDLLVVDEYPVHSVFRNYWMVAAAVLLLILWGGWLFRDRLRYETFTTAFSETKRLELSDGSKVILNANSSLLVPRFGFGENSREVFLTGEANFNITHTQDHKRFVVRTNNHFDIEVLGTEFNVYSRPRGAKIVLHKGKVQLNYQEGKLMKQLVMKPGDLVTMDEHGHTSLKEIDNSQNYSAWKAHRFVFENESLEEVCNLFEDNFGVKVEIPDSSLARQTISGSFTALNAEELLDILADDSGLSYERSSDGKLITLSY